MDGLVLFLWPRPGPALDAPLDAACVRLAVPLAMPAAPLALGCVDLCNVVRRLLDWDQYGTPEGATGDRFTIGCSGFCSTARAYLTVTPFPCLGCRVVHRQAPPSTTVGGEEAVVWLPNGQLNLPSRAEVAVAPTPWPCCAPPAWLRARTVTQRTSSAVWTSDVCWVRGSPMRNRFVCLRCKPRGSSSTPLAPLTDRA